MTDAPRGRVRWHRCPCGTALPPELCKPRPRALLFALKCPTCGRQGSACSAEHDAIEGWNMRIRSILQRDQAAMRRPKIGQPEVGFYTCRLGKHGPKVAVRIWWGEPIFDGEAQDRSHRWNIEVDGETDRIERDDDGKPIGRVLLDVDEYWPFCCGSPITESEYRFLLRRVAWARKHDPQHPVANPRRPIDVRTMKPGW